jgi:hypothetical protein
MLCSARKDKRFITTGSRIHDLRVRTGLQIFDSIHLFALPMQHFRNATMALQKRPVEALNTDSRIRFVVYCSNAR